MTRHDGMDTTELLAKVRTIEIKTKGLSTQLFSGQYHSAFKGRGMSFSEVRSYTWGDDVRFIDWNVTARSGTPHVKVFEEERELTVLLLIDASASTRTGSQSARKQDVMTEIAAVLAFSAIHNNDRVGVLIFSDEVEQYIPPGKGKKHILRIIRELVNIDRRERQTDIGHALRYVNNLEKKRAVCFVLSDFIDEGYGDALRIVAKRHDLVGIHVYDPFERNLPDAGLVKLRDFETGATALYDTSDKRLRDAWNVRFNENLHRMTDRFNRARADAVSIATDAPYVHALLRLFERRERRR